MSFLDELDDLTERDRADEKENAEQCRALLERVKAPLGKVAPIAAGKADEIAEYYVKTAVPTLTKVQQTKYGRWPSIERRIIAIQQLFNNVDQIRGAVKKYNALAWHDISRDGKYFDQSAADKITNQLINAFTLSDGAKREMEKQLGLIEHEIKEAEESERWGISIGRRTVTSQPAAAITPADRKPSSTVSIDSDFTGKV